LQEADAYSKEACIGLGWMAAIVGTRGTVLVAMGNYEEGIKLLKESFENAENALSKAENSCHLAIAFSRRGMPDEAREYLQLARQLNDKCRLITSAEQEVEGNRLVQK
jgi:tetratricopeptide (TPR) repeat protein